MALAGLWDVALTGLREGAEFNHHDMPTNTSWMPPSVMTTCSGGTCQFLRDTVDRPALFGH
jgi:hypothetical protein